MSDRHDLSIEGLKLDLRVLRFLGREAMNDHFTVDVELSVLRPEASSLRATVLGRRATLTMRGGLHARNLHGCVSHVQLIGSHGHDRANVSCRLVPEAHVLTLRRASRTHQDMSAAAIISAVLERARLPHELRIERESVERSYAAQYDETEDEFLRRLAAEEGLFHWLRHDTDRATLCFADSSTGYTRASPTRLEYRPMDADTATVNAGRQLRRFVRSARLGHTAALFRAYDILRPAAAPTSIDAHEPRARSTGPAELVDGGRTLYAHGGPREAALLEPTSAKRILDAADADGDLAEGDSDCPELIPGHVFECFDHTLPELDGSYVPVWIEHEGYDTATTPAGRASYQNRFAAVPAEVPFRPARPKRALRQCLESATVVGPPGQEIHTDDLGRVKVRFHWDLADDPTGEGSSCWLRVVQGWGSSGFGTHFLPRIGSEVAVAYMDGDPDRPVVVGTLYNGAQPGPYSLPEDATRSGIRTRSTPGGAGGHELTFEDRAGEESVVLRSQRNMSVAAVERLDLSAGGDVRIAAGHRLDQEVVGEHSIKVGASSTIDISGREHHSVGGDAHSLVAGNRTRVSGGSETTRVALDASLSVGRSHRIIVSGPTEGPRATSLHSTHGLHQIVASEALQLRSSEVIELSVGNTRVRLTEDALEIDAPTVRILAREIDFDIDKGKSHLRLAGAFTVGAGNIVLGTGGASLALDSEAKLDGALVKLNCGKAKTGGKLERALGPEGVAIFELVGDLAMLTAGVQISLAIRMPSGEVADYPVGPDGRVSLEGRPGDVFTLVAVKADGVPTPALEVRK